MENYNWNQFKKRITIRSTAQTIYDVWTTQAGIESWFLRLAEFKTKDTGVRKRNESIQKGDRYKWLWFGYDDSFVEESEILFVNGKDELEFGFSGGCIVNVKMKEEDNETICELTQSMPMEDEKDQRHFFIECGKGWTFYLANLKSILEGGIDLRNKNVNIQNVVNA
jgi:uncharacterized protein YndB with AHSA1/START domain